MTLEKSFNKKWAQRKHRKQLRRNAKKRHQRLNGKRDRLAQRKAQRQQRRRHKIEYTKSIPPANLSIVNNTEDTIKYFNIVEKLFSRGESVEFVLSETKELTPDALITFTAIISDSKITKGLPFRGISPRDQRLNQLLTNAGFYKYVKPNNPFGSLKTKKNINDELQHRISHKRVEAEMAANVCRSAQQYSYGNSLKNHDLYKVIIECMANTHNHASGESPHEVYDWWLLAYKKPESRVTQFCFLDLGVGIFKSLEKQVKKGFFTSLRGLMGQKKHIEVLRSIFNGNTKTRTGKDERGRGIFEIHEIASKSDEISNFMLVSNDVFAIIERGQNANRWPQKFI